MTRAAGPVADEFAGFAERGEGAGEPFAEMSIDALAQLRGIDGEGHEVFEVRAEPADFMKATGFPDDPAGPEVFRF